MTRCPCGNPIDLDRTDAEGIKQIMFYDHLCFRCATSHSYLIGDKLGPVKPRKIASLYPHFAPTLAPRTTEARR